MAPLFSYTSKESPPAGTAMKSLSGEVGMRVGPLILEVLVKHWFDRLKKDAGEENQLDLGARLKEDDIFYHQAFVIVKSFLNASSSHTIEEIQSFSNTRTPSPPWVHVVRTLVPLSCCDEAATYLIKALGGEDVAQQVVGGVKWWQVRGVDGVDAQWITMKNDWQEAKKRHKMRQEQARMGLASPEEENRSDSNNVYDKDMDAMRCILYLHGGGYYFGSVDQTRYSIQRHARKINGRVFAINYRLAPQYPFPCGLHDALAAYLFLIHPPPGSIHEAVNPAHIIISGDSAGGGLSLALLQVIRDSGLPPPAGGVLISPWCDLTHSFPSVHLNAKSDIIPESGLSFHKPSTLWPPPSADISKHVHASLRFRIKQAFRMDDSAHISQTSTIISEEDVPHHSTSADSSPLSAGPNSREREKVTMKLPTGEHLEISTQLHFYTVNSLVRHPLVSPITGYLGGLPPILFIAGDEEVLRDEIIYTAHKAAYPEKYPVLPSSRLLCPHLQDIEKRHKPTSVHLQVYDGAPHILPVLFPFTIPAKFCFRAIAIFDRFVTDMKMTPPMTMLSQSTSSPDRPSFFRRKSLFVSGRPQTATNESVTRIFDDLPVIQSPQRMASDPNLSMSPVSASGQSSFRQAISSKITQAGSLLQRHRTLLPKKSREGPIRTQSELPNGKQVRNASDDATGLGFQASPTMVGGSTETTAGDPQVYDNIKDRFNWECRMIRERVSTSGIIRPLEPEDELAVCKIHPDHVTQLSEETVRRYTNAKQKFDQQFEHTIQSIEEDRRRNLAMSKEDTIKRVTVLQQSINQKRTDEEVTGEEKTGRPGRNGGLNFDQRVLSSPGWAWSWVLDDLENPPPSSIVARRDTEEARQLAAIADPALEDEEHTMSSNNLWNVIQNFLTATPANGNVPMKTDRKEEGSSNRASILTAGVVEQVRNFVNQGSSKAGSSIFAKASTRNSKP